MRKVLFIGSLNTRKNHFDGERIKTTLIYECLLATGSKVTLVNLSKSKITQTLKLISLSVFFKKRFDSIIVSKDPRGGKIIEKILSFSRVPQDKILYFEIGPFLYQMLCDRDVKPELFSRNRHVIVETASMKRELEEFGFSNVLIFPNFKVRPRVEIEVKHYPKSVLRLVYFSRIEEEKGIYDLLTALDSVNCDGVKFQLEVYGAFQTPSEKERFHQFTVNRDFVTYGGALDTSDPKTYDILKQYDLHVFPTKYPEGFPGSLIDFFFVGVPTISSTFLRAKDILSSRDSFFYRQGDAMDLASVLRYVYIHQEEILPKAKACYDLSDQYTTEAFSRFLRGMLNENECRDC